MRPTVGSCYSRRQISQMLGGSIQLFLPTSGGKVVCGCFKREPRWNPDAPEEVVFGPGPRVEAVAETISRQREAIPIFMFAGGSTWEYIGDYECTGLQTDRSACQEKMKQNPARGEIKGILYFKKA